MKKKKLYTVEDYAALCRVSAAAIYQRIENKVIIPELADNANGKDQAFAIDASKYPPVKLKAGRKKFKIQ